MRTDLQLAYDPPVALLRIAGELDLSTRARLRDAFCCVARQGCTQVRVDLEGITFIDASSLRLLHVEQHRLVQAGGDLEVVAASARYLLVSGAAGYPNLQPATGPTQGSSGIPGAPRGRSRASRGEEGVADGDRDASESAGG